MKSYRILGLLIKDRIKEAGRTQIVLSQYSKSIQSRLGFHEVSEKSCSRVGIILIQLQGADSDLDLLESELKAINGLEVQKMEFEY